MAMRGTRSTSRGQDSGKKPGEQRTRSASRRRRIEAEVAARRQRERYALQLQKGMVTPGVGDALMQAAKQMFQAKDYKAIVEERAVEGLCGYPPCSHYAAGKPGKQKWKINLRDREVYSQEEIGMFCSFECLQDNARFVASLDVDPGYVRLASAAAAARGAVAAADEARRAGSRKRSGTGRRERDGQVKHSDYDGGGGIPEVCQAAAGKKGETTQELVRRLVSAPIVERPEPPQQQALEQQALEQQASEQQPTVPKQEGAKVEDDDDARSAATGDAGSDDEADDIGSDADVSICSTAEEPSDSSDDEPADPLENLWKHPSPVRRPPPFSIPFVVSDGSGSKEGISPCDILKDLVGGRCVAEVQEAMRELLTTFPEFGAGDVAQSVFETLGPGEDGAGTAGNSFGDEIADRTAKLWSRGFQNRSEPFPMLPSRGAGPFAAQTASGIVEMIESSIPKVDWKEAPNDKEDEDGCSSTTASIRSRSLSRSDVDVHSPWPCAQSNAAATSTWLTPAAAKNETVADGGEQRGGAAEDEKDVERRLLMAMGWEPADSDDDGEGGLEEWEIAEARAALPPVFR